jgi:hypothetical protein
MLNRFFNPLCSVKWKNPDITLAINANPIASSASSSAFALWLATLLTGMRNGSSSFSLCGGSGQDSFTLTAVQVLRRESWEDD